MQIVNSKSGNTSVLIGSLLRQYYFRGDGGALINKALGADLMPFMQSGEFQDSIVAHKADVAIITPNRPGYQPERPLTLGDFYINEPFREVWCIPIRSWITDPKTKEYVEGKMAPFILSTFLMRGHSKDEFANLLQPFEEAAFAEWMSNRKALEKKFPGGIQEFASSKMLESISNSIYTFKVAKGEGVKAYSYLEWSCRPPQTEEEKEVLEIASVVGNQHSNLLVNDVVEKAHAKALNGGAATAALPGVSNNNLLPA